METRYETNTYSYFFLAWQQAHSLYHNQTKYAKTALKNGKGKQKFSINYLII